MPDEPTIPNATCPPFAGASARDLLAGILLASGGSATEIPNTTQCREWGYGKYTQRDLLAAILLAIESGGGGDVFNPDVAYVQTNGNNATAELGNPAKPYLTAQAAFDAGARSFELGRGVTASITYSAEGFFMLVIYVQGRGRDQSVLNLNIQSIDSDFELIIRSNKSMLFNNVTLTRGASGPVSLTAMDCYIGTISTNNTMEGGGPTDLIGQIKFSEVEFDTPNADALALAYLSMVEGQPRIQPPS